MFVSALLSEAKKNKNIELVTGDLGFGVLKPFWEALPAQFTNAGIAEQNMMALSAGMAMEGKTVVVYSIGNFPTLRCLEQIRNDCAYHNADVKIVSVGGGMTYGALGMSHHATEDIAVMRALPSVSVVCPGDAAEADAATRFILNTPGTFYMRLGRGGEPLIHKSPVSLADSRAIMLRPIGKITIFSTGEMLSEAASAAEALSSDGISAGLYSFPFVKPIDRDTVLACAADCDLIVTAEEHNIPGGFGSAVAEILAEAPRRARLLRIGLPDTYVARIGSQAELRRAYLLDAAGIRTQVRKALGM